MIGAIADGFKILDFLHCETWKRASERATLSLGNHSCSQTIIRPLVTGDECESILRNENVQIMRRGSAVS